MTFLHLDQLVGDQAVGFAVDGIGGFAARRFDQAEYLTGDYVEPVAQVLHAMLRLGLQVFLVSPRDGLGGQPFDVLVDVQEERHSDFPFPSLEDLGGCLRDDPRVRRR